MLTRVSGTSTGCCGDRRSRWAALAPIPLPGCTPAIGCRRQWRDATDATNHRGAAHSAHVHDRSRCHPGCRRGRSRRGERLRGADQRSARVGGQRRPDAPPRPHRQGRGLGAAHGRHAAVSATPTCPTASPSAGASSARTSVAVRASRRSTTPSSTPPCTTPTWSTARSTGSVSASRTATDRCTWPRCSWTATRRPGPSPLLALDSRGRGIAARAQGGFWVMEGNGTVHAYEGAPAYGSPHFPGDYARDIAVMPDGNGYVILDALGGVHRFGSALFTLVRRGWAVVRLRHRPQHRGHLQRQGLRRPRRLRRLPPVRQRTGGQRPALLAGLGHRPLHRAAARRRPLHARRLRHGLEPWRRAAGTARRTSAGTSPGTSPPGPTVAATPWSTASVRCTASAPPSGRRRCRTSRSTGGARSSSQSGTFLAVRNDGFPVRV